MIRKFVVGCFTSLTVAGCAAPIVSPNPVTSQAKPGHAVDWQALAEQAITRFSAVYQAERPTVFIAPGPADMPFAIVYKNDLEIALMHRGFTVTRSAPGSVVLGFDVQTFLYGRDNPGPPLYASALTRTRAEALVTLTVADGAHLLYSDSQPFYVRPADLSFYETVIPAAVQTISANTPPTTVSLPIHGAR